MDEVPLISSKSEAYNYIYNIHNNIEEPVPEVLEQAKSFFTEVELNSTSFEPLHNINDCFPGVAKACEEGCGCHGSI